MIMRADLHVHTTFSDGTLTPQQLLQAAADRGLEVLAITDHDTLDGADALAGDTGPVRIIPGVELSLSNMQGLHLLGYGAGAHAAPLRARLAALAQARIERAREMIRRLHGLGYPLEEEIIEQQGTVGRAHLARAMVAHGWVGTMAEAFDRFLAEGAPAYVPGERLTMAEALTLLRACGVAPVLAHPALLPVDELALPPLLRAWQEQGLVGVEVYHPAQAGRGFAQLERMVRRMGLLVTGGSDFHAEREDRHGQLGGLQTQWGTAAQDVQALLAWLSAQNE